MLLTSGNTYFLVTSFQPSSHLRFFRGLVMELVVDTTVFEVSEIRALCAAAVTMVAATSASIFMFELEFFKLVTIDVATAFVTSATAVVLTVSRGLKCDHKKNKYTG